MIQNKTTAAKAVHSRLAEINTDEIEAVNAERHMPRKELAKLARTLFKSLGIKGVSVTAPNYSMAQAVHVRMPKRDDYKKDEATGMVLDYATDEAAQANVSAERKLEAILLAAFPNTDNRSDTQSDHFDYKWSIN